MAVVQRKYELYSPEFRANPYPIFAAMREHDPVLRQPGFDGETMIWFVTRYEDVAAVLVDDERFVRDHRLAFTPRAARTADAGERHRRSRRSTTTC